MNTIIKIIRLPFAVILYILLGTGGIVAGHSPQKIHEGLEGIIWPNY